MAWRHIGFWSGRGALALTLMGSLMARGGQAKELPSKAVPPVLQGLERISLAQNPAEADDIPAYLRPNPRGRLRIPLGHGQNYIYGFGTVLEEPHALNGPIRDRTTNAELYQVGDLLLPLHGGVRLGDNQALLAEMVVGLSSLDLDLNYLYKPENLPGIFSANLLTQRDQNPTFNPGFFGPDVNLPNGDNPSIHRLGGGVQYAQSLTDVVDVAVGVNYQRVSVRDGLFSARVVPNDSQGNALTVSPTGQDDLLTLNATFLLNDVDGLAYAVRGSRLRLGLEQSIPIGRGNIAYTRAVANGTRFIPLNLIQLGDYTDTLVLNLQGGLTLGDLPPYATFNLGGVDTVRGYQIGAVAAGRHFMLATAEYRFPLADVTLFDYELPVAGMLFVDYGTDFGSGDTVLGTPGPVRGKPGNGIGYGLGLQSHTPFGILRLEYGFNGRRRSQLYFTVGDRF